jgi:hypothetical protein
MARFLLLVLLFAAPAFSQCISISDAPQHLGKKTCVAAKVVKVSQNENGAFLLNFCAEAQPCPFTVRVFPADFDYVGDVRQLSGKQIEITGKIQRWNHQTEIILRDSDQLTGGLVKLPPIPKTYDVENRGHASPGQFKGEKTTKRSMKKPASGPSEEIDEE